MTDTNVNNDDIYFDDTATLIVRGYALKFERLELTEEFVDIARNELRETPENRDEGVKALRELILNEGAIVVPMENDEILLQFLRPCKFYPDSAYDLMKRFYKFKVKNPKLCKDLVPSNEAKVFEHNLFSVLPNRDQHGRRIMLVEAGNKWIPRDCSLNQFMRGVLMMVEAAAFEAKSQIAGGVVIVDLEGLALNHIMQFTPGIAKTVVHYVQDCTQMRLKGIHIVNQKKIFDLLFNIFKPFLREKLRSRIFFHGTDRESILKHIDGKNLPMKYGGDMDIPDIPGDKMLEGLMRYEKDFLAHKDNGYVEKTKK